MGGADGTPVTLRQLLGYAVHSSVMSSVGAVGASAIPILLGRSLGSEGVALFSVGLAPIMLHGMVTTPLRQAVFPEITALWARGDREVIRRSLVTFGAVALGLGIPAIAGAWVVLPRVIEMAYGSNFVDAAPAARVLLVALLGQLIASWAKMLPLAAGRPGIRTAVDSLTWVVLVAAVGQAAAVGGLVPAALGYVAATMVSGLVWVAVALQLTGPESRLALAPQ